MPFLVHEASVLLQPGPYWAPSVSFDCTLPMGCFRLSRLAARRHSDLIGKRFCEQAFGLPRQPGTRPTENDILPKATAFLLGAGRLGHVVSIYIWLVVGIQVFGSSGYS